MVESIVSAFCVLGVPSFSDCAVCGDGVRPDIITTVGRQLAFDVGPEDSVLVLVGWRRRFASFCREIIVPFLNLCWVIPLRGALAGSGAIVGLGPFVRIGLGGIVGLLCAGLGCVCRVIGALRTSTRFVELLAPAAFVGVGACGFGALGGFGALRV